MNESLLRAILQLFAIVSRTEGVSVDRIQIVKNFLRQFLSPEMSERYYDVFQEFVDKFYPPKKDGAEKRASVSDSVKVLKICAQINKELAQKQKTIALVRMLEFISVGNSIGEQDEEYADTVAQAFNYDESEYGFLKSFVTSNELNGFTSDYLVAISDKNTDNKTLIRTGAESPTYIARLGSSDLYLLRYFHQDELTINGQFAVSFQSHVLTPGAILRSPKFGTVYYTEFDSLFSGAQDETKIYFEVKNLEFEFPGGKKGLYRLSFLEESGRMSGIMGASGAGKSTLLNLLNGNLTPGSGSVKINGINVHQEIDEAKKLIGYVPQDDLLIEELSVFDNLYYAAKLAFGDLNEAELTQKCLDVMDSLGLLHTKDLKVGSPLDKKISGGQRKRLNIALELIRDTKVLFVDEPTSGLSSRDSEMIMDLLKSTAKKGCVVFVVIHQPSSDIFKLFDSLLILDTGGYTAFYGNPVEAIGYFKDHAGFVGASDAECGSCGNVNPESIFNIIDSKLLDEFGNLTKDRKLKPADYYELYNKQLADRNISAPKAVEKPELKAKKASWFRQLGVFLSRDVKSKLSNLQYLLINILEAPLLALLLAGVMKSFNGEEYVFADNENIPSYLFISVVVALFIGLTVSAEEIFKDRKILRREKFLSLSKGAYLASKIAILFSVSAVQMLFFVVIGDSILEIKDFMFTDWLVMFSVACFANVLGLNISSAFNSAVTIYILVPILIIPQLMLSGAIIGFDRLHPALSKPESVSVVGNVMASRWAYEALATNHFVNNKATRPLYTEEAKLNTARHYKGEWLEKFQEVLNDPKLSDVKKRQVIEEEWNELIAQFLVPKVVYEGYKKALASPSSDNVNAYTKALESFLVESSLSANKERDTKVSSIGAEQLAKLEADHKNKALDMIVRQKLVEKKFLFDGDHVILKGENVYRKGEHFYAYSKTLNGRTVSSLVYNLAVIWMMTGLLFIALRFDLLARLMRNR